MFHLCKSEWNINHMNKNYESVSKFSKKENLIPKSKWPGPLTASIAQSNEPVRKKNFFAKVCP